MPRRVTKRAVAVLLAGATGAAASLTVSPEAGAQAAPARVAGARAAGASAQGGQSYTPSQFGAAGDGVTDDTGALQRALDHLQPGDTLSLPDGRTYAHSGTLTVRVPDVRLTGGGTLLATREATSSLIISADGAVVDGHLTVRTDHTTGRWSSPRQVGIALDGHSGVTVSGVTVDGSASAGIFVFDQSSHFTIDSVTVRDTRADGIHITGASHDGVVTGATVSGTGDDGVAVVSYRHDGAPCHDIRISSTRFLGNHWGRGFSVVGGRDVTLQDISSTGSSAGGLYIASEPAWDTYGVQRVTVQDATLNRSNLSAVDNGAVLVWSGNRGQAVSDVDLSGVTISGTRPGVSRIVGILTSNGGTVSRVRMTAFTVIGTGRLFGTNVPGGSYDLGGWTYDGRAQAVHAGWVKGLPNIDS